MGRVAFFVYNTFRIVDEIVCDYGCRRSKSERDRLPAVAPAFAKAMAGRKAIAGAARMPGGIPVGRARRLVHKLKILGVGSWWAKGRAQFS